MEFDYWPIKKTDHQVDTILKVGRLYKTLRIFIIYDDTTLATSTMKDIKYLKRNTPFLVTDMQPAGEHYLYQIMQEEIIGWVAISQNYKIDEFANK